MGGDVEFVAGPGEGLVVVGVEAGPDEFFFDDVEAAFDAVVPEGLVFEVGFGGAFGDVLKGVDEAGELLGAHGNVVDEAEVGDPHEVRRGADDFLDAFFGGAGLEGGWGGYVIDEGLGAALHILVAGTEGVACVDHVGP